MLRLIVLFWNFCITCRYYSSIPAKRQPVVNSIYQRRGVVRENYCISAVCFSLLSKVCLYKTYESISFRYIVLYITELACSFNATYFVRGICHSLICNNLPRTLFILLLTKQINIFIVFIVNNENIHIVLILCSLREKR